MDVTVWLTDTTQSLIGSVEIHQDSPGVPQALVWKGRVFLYQPTYGELIFYSEVISVQLSDGSVTLV